jgi:hypothetical protein
MKTLCMIVLILGVSACQTGIVPIAKRDMYEKEGKSSHLGHRRPVEEKSEPATQVFVKRESLAIVPEETQNHTGSLFSLKNPDHLLFVDPPRGALGDSLDIAVRVNRTDRQPNANNQTPPAAGNPPQPVGNTPRDAKAVQDELIAALPKLEPGLPDAKVPASIKMKVVRKLENGDVIVEASRASQNDWEAHSVRALGRIPRDKLQGRQELTTNDLADVQWSENHNGEFTERESSLWEDEYTMRWAGFDEARSKMALDLDNKRKDLEKVKERLQDRINNLGKERGQIAQERERVSRLRQEAEQKLNEMNKKIEEQNSLLEQQKETIKKQEEIIGGGAAAAPVGNTRGNGARPNSAQASEANRNATAN